MTTTYSIGTLTGLTGLSQHTIRAWERRYGALVPARGSTNRRVYTDSDIERLVLLRRVVESGHSIGHVAGLPDDQLRHLLAGNEATNPRTVSPSQAGTLLADSLEAVSRLDPERLDRILSRGNAELGIFELLDEVIIPLLSAIGERWVDGSLRISQEHMASAVLRSFLQRVRHSIPSVLSGPRIVVSTPVDQHHELGALMVSIVAAMEYWNVTYLGPNLPAVEIADAVRMTNARAVALSLIYPVDDAKLAHEFRILRGELGPRFPILVGGSGAPYYRETLAENDAEWCSDLGKFRQSLDQVANGATR